MRENTKNNAKPKAQDLAHLPDISDTASSTECTGLMPTTPKDESELKSYGELFTMETSNPDAEA